MSLPTLSLSLSFTPRRVANVFSPISLDPTLWLDAGEEAYSDAGSTLAVDDDPVQQWQDQSGNNRHVNQATQSNRPTYKTGVVNDKPVLRGDGSDDDLFGTFTTDDIINADEFTLFVVAKLVNPVTSAANRWQNDVVIANNEGFWGMYTNDNPRAFLFNWDGNSDGTGIDTDSTNFHILEARHASDVIGFRIDGSSEATAASGDTTDLTGIVGIFQAYTGQNAELDIAEIIVYDSFLSDFNLGKVRDYLGNKYDISLP